MSMDLHDARSLMTCETCHTYLDETDEIYEGEIGDIKRCVHCALGMNK